MSSQNVQDEMPKLNVFISHAGEDMEIARALQNAIEGLCGPNNIDVFLDYDHIDPGSEISDTIKEFLCRAEQDNAVECASRNDRADQHGLLAVHIIMSAKI